MLRHNGLFSDVIERKLLAEAQEEDDKLLGDVIEIVSYEHTKRTAKDRTLLKWV